MVRKSISNRTPIPIICPGLPAGCLPQRGLGSVETETGNFESQPARQTSPASGQESCCGCVCYHRVTQHVWKIADRFSDTHRSTATTAALVGAVRVESVKNDATTTRVHRSWDVLFEESLMCVATLPVHAVVLKDTAHINTQFTGPFRRTCYVPARPGKLFAKQ